MLGFMEGHEVHRVEIEQVGSIRRIAPQHGERDGALYAAVLSRLLPLPALCAHPAIVSLLPCSPARANRLRQQAYRLLRSLPTQAGLAERQAGHWQRDGDSAPRRAATAMASLAA